jgi:hypothetical protein
MIQPTDLAWAAGFFDGEACISVVRCTHKDCAREQVQVLLDVAQVHPASLERLVTLFGGRIRVSRNGQDGAWRINAWRIYGRKAGVILQHVLPYLIGKRRQAELCVELLSLHGVQGRRRSDAVYARALAIAEELRILNRRQSRHAERLSESAPQSEPLRMVR